MKTWIIYTDTGEVVGRMAGAQPVPAELDGNYAQEGSANADTEYILNSAVTPKPNLSLTASATTFTTAQIFSVSGIPAGSIVIHPGGSSVIDDGALEWSTVEPGNYQIEIKLFPYISEVFNLAVTA